MDGWMNGNYQGEEKNLLNSVELHLVISIDFSSSQKTFKLIQEAIWQEDRVDILHKQCS